MRKAAKNVGRRIIEGEVVQTVGGIAMGPIIEGIGGVLWPSSVEPGTVFPKTKLPPIRQPTFPEATFPQPKIAQPKAPPSPELGPLPMPPEVITVTGQKPARTRLPKSRSKLKKVSRAAPWGLLGPVLRPILRGRPAPRPSSFFSPPSPLTLPTPSPTTTTTPRPLVPTDPLTPPRIPGVDPLTPRLTSLNPLPLPSGQGFLAPQTPTDQDECRKCEERKKQRRRPSNVIADVGKFKRRMSQNSLDNLKRGK